jgi:hypothetical protein
MRDHFSAALGWLVQVGYLDEGVVIKISIDGLILFSDSSLSWHYPASMYLTLIAMFEQ